MNTGLKIGEIAARAGVPVATVRYYERRGLIASPRRTASGYRQYTPETASRILFIKRARDLGFSLDETQELLELRVGDPGSCAAVAARTKSKIYNVERKIAELKRLEDILADLVDSCEAREPTAECPVLELLSEEEAGA